MVWTRVAASAHCPATLRYEVQIDPLPTAALGQCPPTAGPASAVSSGDRGGCHYCSAARTLFVQKQLQPNSAYHARVRAENFVGWGEWSEWSSKVACGVGTQYHFCDGPLERTIAILSHDSTRFRSKNLPMPPENSRFLSP